MRVNNSRQREAIDRRGQDIARGTRPCRDDTAHHRPDIGSSPYRANGRAWFHRSGHGDWVAPQAVHRFTSFSSSYAIVPSPQSGQGAKLAETPYRGGSSGSSSDPGRSRLRTAPRTRRYSFDNNSGAVGYEGGTGGPLGERTILAAVGLDLAVGRRFGLGWHLGHQRRRGCPSHRIDDDERGGN
jgi:hypothetical protein